MRRRAAGRSGLGALTPTEQAALRAVHARHYGASSDDVAHDAELCRRQARRVLQRLAHRGLVRAEGPQSAVRHFSCVERRLLVGGDS